MAILLWIFVPGFTAAGSALLICFMMRCRMDEAIARERGALAELQSALTLAYHYLGNALLGLARYPEAARQFRTCLGYNPNHIPALGNFGLTLIHLGRHGEALQIFEQIIDATENPVELWAAYTNIGQIYKDWGQAAVSELYSQK